MFGFCVFDRKKNKLFLARDRLGIKPMFYLQSEGTFAFASELKAFQPLRTLGFPFDLDEKQVGRFFGFTWLPNNGETMIKNVHRIKPGELVEYDLSKQEIVKTTYWELQLDSKVASMNLNEALERYEELLDDSVRLRLQADVPVGVMLSGGLDSSIISVFAQKHSRHQIRTYTLVFDHKNSENEYAKIVSDHIGTDHHELFISTKNFLPTLKETMYYFDDLSTVDGGLITTILMGAKLKESDIKVILLGEGSDEINCGYGKFMFCKFPFNVVPEILRNTAFYYAMSRYSPFRKGFFDHALYTNKILKSFPGNILQKFSRFDVEHQLPNHLLMKVDKATMAQSIEARVPFLDHRLVQFIYNLKEEFKLQGKFFDTKTVKEKYILRELANKYLPESISKRKKFGMMLPTGDVLKENFDEIKAELLDSREQLLHQSHLQPYLPSVVTTHQTTGVCIL